MFLKIKNKFETGLNFERDCMKNFVLVVSGLLLAFGVLNFSLRFMSILESIEFTRRLFVVPGPMMVIGMTLTCMLIRRKSS